MLEYVDNDVLAENVFEAGGIGSELVACGNDLKRIERGKGGVGVNRYRFLLEKSVFRFGCFVILVVCGNIC